MTDTDILAQAAATWAKLEQHLIEQLALSPSDQLEAARSGCIATIVDCIRGELVIEVKPQAELLEPPEPMPPIDRTPVSWWSNRAVEPEELKVEDWKVTSADIAEGHAAKRRAQAAWKSQTEPAADEKARWDRHIDHAIHGYDGDDEVEHRRR
jgi:hypothetical protein